MRKLLLLVLSCAPAFATSPPPTTNKEIIRPSPKRFYINNLDIIEFHEGSFRIIFYMSENFDVFDGVNLKRDKERERERGKTFAPPSHTLPTKTSKK